MASFQKFIAKNSLPINKSMIYIQCAGCELKFFARESFTLAWIAVKHSIHIRTFHTNRVHMQYK